SFLLYSLFLSSFFFYSLFLDSFLLYSFFFSSFFFYSFSRSPESEHVNIVISVAVIGPYNPVAEDVIRPLLRFVCRYLHFFGSGEVVHINVRIIPSVT